MRRFFAFAALVCAAVAAAALEVPYLSGRVNDLVGLLNEETRARLEQKLAGLEQATGAQMAVLIIPSLEGENLEDFSHRVASTWQLGQKGKDNGVLFLIAKNDRKMRLEVGYGLESVLTDATCRRILDNLVRPHFRAGRFDAGVEEAVAAVAALISGEKQVDQVVPKKRSAQNAPWYFRLFIFLIGAAALTPFTLRALFAQGFHSWYTWFVLLPFWTALTTVVQPHAGLVVGVLWLLGVPIVKVLVGHSSWGRRFRRRYPALAMFGSASPRGRGGFWSGGFSGGGGSFGGGGASSSW
ncbi:MAG: hypothetical protein KatS3mg007_0755 [Thermoanaerobaculum sp.]|nr:MAG: hypothetical protein KatS3mg007_0755 [Thermoanaerobaculum sp.]